WHQTAVQLRACDQFANRRRLPGPRAFHSKARTTAPTVGGDCRGGPAVADSGISLLEHQEACQGALGWGMVAGKSHAAGAPRKKCLEAWSRFAELTSPGEPCRVTPCGRQCCRQANRSSTRC